MSLFGDVVQATNNLRYAPSAYLYGLVVYYAVSVLIIYFSLRKIIKMKNRYLSIFIGSFIVSFLVTPTMLYGGGAAAIMPASFAFVLSAIFSNGLGLVFSIVPVLVVALAISTIWFSVMKIKSHNNALNSQPPAAGTPKSGAL